MKKYDDGSRDESIHSLLHKSLKLVRECENRGMSDEDMGINPKMIEFRIIEVLEQQLKFYDGDLNGSDKV